MCEPMGGHGPRPSMRRSAAEKGGKHTQHHDDLTLNQRRRNLQTRLTFLDLTEQQKSCYKYGHDRKIELSNEIEKYRCTFPKPALGLGS